MDDLGNLVWHRSPIGIKILRQLFRFSQQTIRLIKLNVIRYLLIKYEDEYYGKAFLL